MKRLTKNHLSEDGEIPSKKLAELNWTVDRPTHMHRMASMYFGCPICGANSGCNARGKSYGGRVGGHHGRRNQGKLRYPSWKLATRNRRQWMPKRLSVTSKTNYAWYGDITYITIKF